MKRILTLVLALMMLCMCLTATAEVVRGGTLVAAKTSAWSNLNPTKTNARADDRYVIGQIYEPLIDIDENGNFVPQLATAWTVDDEKIVLTLRDDVVFHDGTKFK